MTMAEDLAARIKRLLESLPVAALAPFLADWPLEVQRRTLIAAQLPVLSWLAEVRIDRSAFGRDLVAAVCQAAPSLAWRQTYSVNDVERSFLDNYGWCEIIGREAPLASERIACGFLLLGPHAHYPRHRHDAEEIYLPLSGAAAWQQGDGVWRERSPGTPIHHAGGEPHAMRTDACPLLALYLWRGADLARKAQLDPPGTTQQNTQGPLK
jgi:hypothetical protein